MGMFRKLLLAAVLLFQDHGTPVYGQSEPGTTIASTEPGTTIASTVAGVMVPSLAQPSLTQTPINTNNASSATNSNQPLTITALDAQDILGTSENGTTAGVMVPSLAQPSPTQTPINTSNASSATNSNQPLTVTAIDAQDIFGTSGNGTTDNSTLRPVPLTRIARTTADLINPTAGTFLPTASAATTIEGNGTEETTFSPTANNCNAVKVTLGEYNFSSNVASRTLTFSEPKDYYENVIISCIPDCNVTDDNTHYTVANLTTCVSYTINITNFQCQPPNFNLSYPWAVPPDKQLFTLKTEINSTAVNFSWIIDDVGWKNCNLTFEYECTGGETPIKKTYGSERATIGGLNSNTTYSCSSNVTHLNNIIKTNNSDILTEFGDPDEVQNLSCTPNATSNTTIGFSWSFPAGSKNGIDGYLVTCSEKDIQMINATILNFSCFGYSPYTSYKVFVKAFKQPRYNNKNNTPINGTESTTICQTASSEPGLVTKVKVHSVSNEVHIKCEPPNNPNGPDKIFILTLGDQLREEPLCTFHLTKLSYLTNYTFQLVFSNGDYKGAIYKGFVKTKYNERALIGFLAFLIIVTSIALIVVLYKIYKLQRASDRDADERVELVAREEDNILNVDPIPGELLLETHRRKMADEARLFLEEFQSIPRVFSKLSQRHAREPHNLVKNRYVDILPYDENRVALNMINGEPGSDYINASFINGFKEHRKYIAAQGPKDETTKDFWRMIWEQKSSIIVMVTRCEEGNRVKCAEYWPSLETGTLTFGDITVVIKNEKRCPDYIIRKLHVSNTRERSSEREVTHIQFISWPDHGVPDDPYLLLKLRRRVNAFSNFFSGPIIVHCSAGVGRTGTYISIDAMLEGLDSENRVDVYGYVVALRRQRCLMVQVEAQYILIHHALVEYFLFGETELNLPEIAMSLENLKKKDPPTDPSLLEAEFQRLPSYKNWRPQNVGNKAENKVKNRSSHVVPYEFNRVGIRQDDEHSTENAEDSDDSSDDEQDYEQATKYINASFINGYWAPKAIIAAQGPLQDTVSDFWLMIFQRKVKIIVMLTPSTEVNQESCAKYWGDQKQTYDDIEVEAKDVIKSQSYTVRLFEVRHAKRKETRKVYQYQFEHWNAKELPKHPNNLLTLVQNVKQKVLQNTTNEERRLEKASPILVHCSDGAQQTGVVCALWNLLQCAEAEGAVDVFHTVKSLRKERPGFITTFEEYQFIYDTLAMAYPAQNGQQEKSIRQENEVEMPSETGKLAQKAPSLRQGATHAEPIQNPEAEKKMENSTNGLVAPAPTDIELKIE